ncbi:sugar transmembrane transporter [Aureococcus anophagefferens]|nr:sugar transmembrane transporter [Aureococcus anophagefferens]
MALHRIAAMLLAWTLSAAALGDARRQHTSGRGAALPRPKQDDAGAWRGDAAAVAARLRGGGTLAEAFATTIAPTVGTVVANAMFLASLPAVLAARRAGDLGSLNPTPWAFILVNCLAWLHYGYLNGNPYIYWSNAPGCLLGLFFTLTGASLGSPAQVAAMEKVAVGFAAVHVAASFVTSLYLTSPKQKQLVAGYVANVILVIYYGAPLSTLAEVLATKDAASIFAPLCALNGANGLLWVTYGLTIADPFVWVPNSMGVVLAATQLAVKGAFGGATA